MPDDEALKTMSALTKDCQNSVSFKFETCVQTSSTNLAADTCLNFASLTSFMPGTAHEVLYLF